MSRLIHEPYPTARSVDRRPLVVGGVAAIALAAFLIAPGNVASKTHVALHGLCAQRPSHSLQIGGSTLPMDARMTGIYIGAAVTCDLADCRPPPPSQLEFPLCLWSPCWRCLSSRLLSMASTHSSSIFDFRSSMNRRTCCDWQPGCSREPRLVSRSGISLPARSGLKGDRGRAVVTRPRRASCADRRLGGDRRAGAPGPSPAVCAICCWPPGRGGRRVLAAWNSRLGALVRSWLVVSHLGRSGARWRWRHWSPRSRRSARSRRCGSRRNSYSGFPG